MCRTPFIKINDKAFSLIDCAESIFMNGCLFNGIPSTSHIFSYSGYKNLNIEDTYCTDSPETIDNFIDSNYIIFNGHRFSLFCACPCGKCDECHYNNVCEFESRIIMEAAAFPEMYFFTLTYDDSHLPPEGLRKSDMVKFNKRLRFRVFKHFGARVRLVYCGEYGKKTHRPHYHGLMFFDRSFTMQERYELFSMFNHTRSYQSSHPNSPNIWPLGFRRDIQFCKSPSASARYLSKYVSKQYISKSELSYHYTPEFIQTPRGCALGCTDLHKYSDFIHNTTSGSLSINIFGQFSTVRINRKMIEKFYPNLSHFVQGYRHSLCEFQLMFREIEKRELLWLPDDIVNDAYFHVKYLNNLLLTLRQKNRNICMSKFISKMSDTELCDNLFYLANYILHAFPSSDEYQSILLKKQNFYDRICNSDLNRVTLRHDKHNKLESRLDYVNKRMMYNDSLE